MTLHVAWCRKTLRINIPLKKLTSGVCERVLGTLGCDIKQSCFLKLAACVGNVLRSVVANVDRQTGWINDDIVIAVESKDFVVNWRHPVHALNHPAQCFIHHHQLSIGPASRFGEFREYLCWISGKALSGSGVMNYTNHELVVTLRLLAIKKRPAACSQQTTSSWQNRMYTHGLNRFKITGTNAAQTPSSASAPDQIGTLVGAGAREVTATNQSPSTVAGGGRHAAV